MALMMFAPQRALAPRSVPARRQALLSSMLSRRPSLVVRAGDAKTKPEKVLTRAPSAFNLFYKAKYSEVRAKLTSQNKPSGLPECNLELRTQWKDLPEKDKQPYENEAAKLKEQVAANRAAGVIPKTERTVKPKGTSEPRAPNAYALFVKSEFHGFKEKNPEKKTVEVMKMVSQKWASLPAPEKEVFMQKAKAAAESLKAAAAAAPAPAPAQAAASNGVKAKTPGPGLARRRSPVPRQSVPPSSRGATVAKA